MKIGTRGVEVTRLGLGCASLGGYPHGTAPEDQAIDTIAKALELGVSYFDTAPFYGYGKSEMVVGRALNGIDRAKYVISTKVGRVLVPTKNPSREELSYSRHSLKGYTFLQAGGYSPLEPIFDYSRDGNLNSIEDSLTRLELDEIDIIFIHDPDEGESVETEKFGEPVHYEQALDESFRVLAELRSQGLLKTIGVGMNQWQALARFIKDSDLDCILLAGRYTLLDQSALPELLPLCEKRGVGVVLGGPYNSGVLASPSSPNSTYFYSKTPGGVLERINGIGAICDKYNVSLKAASLQFVLNHSVVTTVIPGSTSPAEMEENMSVAIEPIPSDMWGELKHEGYIDNGAPTPTK